MEARPLYEAKVTKTNKYSVIPISISSDFDLFSGRIEEYYAIFEVPFLTFIRKQIGLVHLDISKALPFNKAL